MPDIIDHSDGSPVSDNSHVEPEYCCNGSSPDDIVISGFSGRYPWSTSVEDFREKLYAKFDFFRDTDLRWERGLFNMSFDRKSVLLELDKFDNEFFGVNPQVANGMSSEDRILQEVCYEAIADSGYDPDHFRGKKVSVYNANTEHDIITITQQRLTNSSHSFNMHSCFLANRFSYLMDLKGFSSTMDSACCSSLSALDFAYHDILTGRSDAAVVCCNQLGLHPVSTNQFMVTGFTSKAGCLRPFDELCNGTMGGETIGALFIQKASDARRIYAKIAAIDMASAGFNPKGITVPSASCQIAISQSNLDKAKVKASDIGYVEAHGTGTIINDVTEGEVLTEVYLKERKGPLLFGTIKSNVGHTKASAGYMGVLKTIFAFESGYIAPNNNFDKPNPNIQALVDGRLKIVQEVTALTTPFVAVHSAGFGGMAGQVILKRNEMDVQMRPTCTVGLPQIMLCCGRTEEGLKVQMSKIIHSKPNREYFALLHELAYSPVSKKQYRGYAVLNDGAVTDIKQVNSERKVWFILTGMGCQWPGMATDLMQIKVFGNSMKRSAEVLKRFGIDLIEYIQADSKHLLQQRNILPAFVSICAIQIALIDLLNELGIKPDGIIGHSTGELACAYADGCCTAEQVLVSAYWRGKSVHETELPLGKMAAVGLSWEEAKRKCPQNVIPACHNASNSVTISGLADDVTRFMEELKRENIFVREVNAYGWAWHSKFIAKAAPTLKANMEKAISQPKCRSKRWISSSYPPELWNELSLQTADAEYFTHNLVSSVFFAEAVAVIPADAIMIEIGSHSLLRSVLKQGTSVNADYIGLMKKNENNINHILSSIGQMYSLGLDPKVQKLYPLVNYPVPRGTPGLADYITWDHATSWATQMFIRNPGYRIQIDLNLDKEDDYLLDHFVVNRALFPGAGYIVLAWETLAASLCQKMQDIPVIITDFKIHKGSILKKGEAKSYVVSISSCRGYFEIVERGSLLASGKIEHDPNLKTGEVEPISEDSIKMISGVELYDDFSILGYKHGPSFQCIESACIDGTHGFLKWNGKWISYLDAHLAFLSFTMDISDTSLPVGLQSLKINPKTVQEHLKNISTEDAKNSIPIHFYKDSQSCISPGLEITCLKMAPVSQSQSTENVPRIEKYSFVPFLSDCSVSDQLKKEHTEYMNVCCQVCLKIASKLKRSLSYKTLMNTEQDTEYTSEDIVNKYSDCSSDLYILLKSLKSLNKLMENSEFLKTANNILDAYVDRVQRDLLYKTLLDEKYLGIFSEIMLENKIKTVDAVEICMTKTPIIVEMMKALKSVSLMEKTFPSGLLLHPTPDSLDVSQFAEDIRLKKFSKESYEEAAKKNGFVITSFIFGDFESLQQLIATLSPSINDKSFVIFFHRHQITPIEEFFASVCNRKLQIQPSEVIENLFEKNQLKIVSKFSDYLGCNLYLLRPDGKEKYSDIQNINIKNGKYDEWVEELKTALRLANSGALSRVYAVSMDDQCTGIIGMTKCLVKEPGVDKLRCIAIIRDEFSKGVPLFDPNNPFYADVIKNDLVLNVYQDESWGSYRHFKIDLDVGEKKVQHGVIDFQKYGDLSSAKWFESPYKYECDENGKSPCLVHVVYGALNFRDVMVSSGKLNKNLVKVTLSYPGDKCYIGVEFSGVTDTGRRVMGVSANRSLASTMHRKNVNIIDIPDHWTLEEAATVPSVYATVYCALILRGRLTEKESILIHCGAGGIGIAAIRIALSLHCKVFTTVGSNAKREYIKKTFPQIKDENIGYSRDTSFEKMIRKQTNGKGVDVVLNSLAGEQLKAGMRCLGNLGRFLEIGAYDIATDLPFGLGMFQGGKQFHDVTLLDYMKSDSMVNLLQEGIQKGIVQPLDRTVFESDRIEDAFRFMARGQHIGKVILKIRDEPAIGTVPRPLEISAIPCHRFYQYKVYIVAGGLSGFGMQLVGWLIERGAVNIILTSRKGISTSYQELYYDRWKKMGGKVVISMLNIAIKEEAAELLAFASGIGPIGGIFNSAMVLKDALFKDQDANTFKESCDPKVAGTLNLDELTRRSHSSLDFFVGFSSIAGGKGNPGQTNYGFGNSAMDMVCEKRRKDNLHGLSIQWGPIGDVGAVHRNFRKELPFAMGRQSIRSCLDTLEKLLLQDNSVVACYIKYDESRDILMDKDIINVMAKLMGYSDVSKMNTSKKFVELGMDSLIGVELLGTLERQYDIVLEMKDLQEMSVNDIKEMVDSAKTDKSNDSKEMTDSTKVRKSNVLEEIVDSAKADRSIDFTKVDKSIDSTKADKSNHQRVSPCILNGF